MMGERTVAQEALFYEFSLERHVPGDHLLRSIDRFVDLTAIREHLRPFYSEMGRPSIDPELAPSLEPTSCSTSAKTPTPARRASCLSVGNDASMTVPTKCRPMVTSATAPAQPTVGVAR